MKISHIEHLGIAVKSIEEALPYYENVLGLKCYNIETVEDQKVRTAFLKVGDTKIELLEPTCPESTIAKFIENKGAGVHHVKQRDPPDRQSSAQRCRRPEHCFPSPEINFGRTDRTLRTLKRCTIRTIRATDKRNFSLH